MLFLLFSFNLTCFDSDDCQVILDSDYTKNKKPTPFCGDGPNSVLVIFAEGYIIAIHVIVVKISMHLKC